MPYIGDIFLGQGVLEPYRSNRTNITDNNTVGCTTPEPLSASTKKLFDAIYDENLEAFNQALADGADVNAFDEEGITPLMSIANAYIASNNQPTLEKIAKLLIQNSNIDINAQSKQPICDERQKRNQLGHLIYLFRNQEIVEAQPGYYRYRDNDQPVDDGEFLRLGFSYESVKEEVRTSSTRKDTALHIVCQVGVRDMVKILLTHPDVETDVKNCKYKSPEGCISRGFENTIKLEFKKAEKGKQLLDALSNRDIYRAKTLLNQEFNPNCWRRNKNGEIETPLSLSVGLCSEGITENKKEVLVELLKHKDLDFSQVKPIPAIEQNIQLKRIIEQAIKVRLIDTINKKDLDDVKKLVEDNCFINYAIVIAALEDVNNPTELIKKYFVKRPLAGMGDIPVGFEKFVYEVVNGLEEAKAQLAKKEKELSDARQELNKRNDKIGKQQNRILELERELHYAKIRLAKGDIKKSAEDNCFMGCTIVTAMLENVSEKFPASVERPLASTDSTPIGFEQGVAKLTDQLESVQAQLAEKKKELSDIKQELNKRNNEIREQQNRISELERELDQTKAQLTEKDRELNNTREESRIHRVGIGKESDGQAVSPNRKQNNYALTFFILCGISTGGACLTIVDYPEISTALTAVALGLFLVGYFLYKGDEKDIGPVSTTDIPEVTRIFISSPDSAESFYTY